ncbi:MAG: hypothetical protein CBC32_004710 [Proteobacteria bacterium TMED72]|nr:MAG: hypothetical protein CBC32_004710 [Proteobacteria bacterium TMED72]
MAAKDRKWGTTLGFMGLGLAVITVILWFRQASQVAIPENRSLWVASFVLAALIGVSAFVKGTRWYGAIPALMAIVIGSFLTFTVAISRQEVSTAGIQVGETVPLFTAIDRHGERFDSATLGGKPTLMKFFRGHW